VRTVPIPTADNVRTLLQGYNITSSIIDDDFIDDSINDEVIPYVENFARTSFTGEKTVVEYYSGNGRDELMLNRKNIVETIEVKLISSNDIDISIDIKEIDTIPGAGILKIRSGLSEFYNFYRIFPKGNDNVKVTYKVGGECPADVAVAIKKLAAILVLDQMEGRTGGGQLSGQSFNRTYGNMGKFSNIRKRFSNQAHAILRRYSTSVIGN
jgi:hypothetical protein